MPAFRRERWDTPDGDFIDLDWVDGGPARPLVVLFHGLEGSSRSHYARSLMRAVQAAGWRGVVVHFRGCSGEPNRLPRAYHSGDTDEADWILRRLRCGHAPGRMFVAGVSLGGNVLLKWLGERNSAAEGVVDAAAAVSAPVDLAAAGHALGQGFNRLYTEHFLRTLRVTALTKHQRFPGLLDGKRIRAARSLFDFDEAVTAPLHGFAGAADYWARCSSKPWLGDIRVPTLVINALNDPFLPARALPAPAECARQVILDIPAEGGHVGFVAGAFPGHLHWLPERLMGFFRLFAGPAEARESRPANPPRSFGHPGAGDPQGA